MPDENPRPENDLPPAAGRGILPWLVGLFALWQLVFPPLANLIEFVPLRPTAYDIDPPIETTQRWGQFTDVEPIQQVAETLGTVLSGWSEITGQEQGWNMFTPAFPPYTVIPVAEFYFPDGTNDRVSSWFEPDPASPRSRFPMIYDREFNYEANVFMIAWHCYPESLAERPEAWRRLPEMVRENEHLVTRWLSWRTKQYAITHPEKPTPIEVVLILRYIPTPAPGGPHQRAAFDRPFARWFPTVPPDPVYMRLEGYDPIDQRFMRLKHWVQP